MAKIFAADQVEDFRLNPEFVTFGVFLFEDTLLGRIIIIPSSIVRTVAADGTVAHTHRKVGVRRKCLFRVHLFQAGEIQAFALGDIVIRITCELLQFEKGDQDGQAQLGSRVLLQLRIFFWVLQHGSDIVIRQDRCLLEYIGGILFIIAFILFVHLLVDIRKILCRNPFLYDLHHSRQHLLVEACVIILEKRLDIIFEEDIDLFRGRAFHIHTLDHTGQLHDLGAAQERFAQVGGDLLIFAGRSISFFQQVQDVTVHLFTLCILCHPGSKSSFFFAFAFDHFQVGKPLIHANRIFPVIGTASIFGGIFDTHLVALQHRVFPDRLFDATHFDTRLIAILDTLLHTP